MSCRRLTQLSRSSRRGQNAAGLTAGVDTAPGTKHGPMAGRMSHAHGNGSLRRCLL